jgi:hypothetical protein
VRDRILGVNMQVLARAVFGVAAAAAALGGGGLVVAPHDEPPGAGAGHDHAATVYRLPILLVASTPGIPEAADLAHHVTSAHAAHLRALLGLDGAGVSPVHPLAELAGAAVLALLVVAVPRLPRPTRRAVAEVPRPRMRSAQWHDRLCAPPPRLPAVLCQ